MVSQGSHWPHPWGLAPSSLQVPPAKLSLINAAQSAASPKGMPLGSLFHNHWLHIRTRGTGCSGKSTTRGRSLRPALLTLTKSPNKVSLLCPFQRFQSGESESVVSISTFYEGEHPHQHGASQDRLPSTTFMHVNSWP